MWAVERVFHGSTISGSYLARAGTCGVPLQTGTRWPERSVPILWWEGQVPAAQAWENSHHWKKWTSKTKYTRKKQAVRYCLLSEILSVLRNNRRAWRYLVHVLSCVSCGLNGWETTAAELRLLVLRLARRGWGSRTWADLIIIGCKLNAWAHGTHFFCMTSRVTAIHLVCFLSYTLTLR